MASGQCVSVILAAFLMGTAWGQGVDSGARTGEFAGKVVIAGSRTQVETAIDIIADAIEKEGVPVRVVSGETSRRAENEKLPTNGAVSLIYVNSDIAPRQRPALSVECWDPQGTSLWKEQTSLTVSGGAQASAKRMAERIVKDIEKSRIGGPGLPKK